MDDQTPVPAEGWDAWLDRQHALTAGLTAPTSASPSSTAFVVDAAVVLGWWAVQGVTAAARWVPRWHSLAVGLPAPIQILVGFGVCFLAAFWVGAHG